METKDLIQEAEALKTKWKPIIESESLPAIQNDVIRNITIRMLENEERALRDPEMNEAATTTTTDVTPGGAIWDPVLISLVRRAAPSLIAHDLMGVQPMNGPSGLIFSIKSYYGGSGYNGGSGVEALGLEVPNPAYSGTSTNNYTNADVTNRGLWDQAIAYVEDDIVLDPLTGNWYICTTAGTSDAAGTGVASDGGVGEPVWALYIGDAAGITTAAAEALGVRDNSGTIASPWAQMSFTIDKATVTSKTRALKAQYSNELAHDLRVVHGLDAGAELANILSTEIVAEQNREIVDTIRKQAKVASEIGGTTGPGIYNIGSSGDSGGRWEQEHYKNIVAQINRAARKIALETRRGIGNVVVTSPEVAAALDMAFKLDINRPAYGAEPMNEDLVGITYAGMLLGKYKVFVDPYLPYDEILVGYKGANVYDAGYYFCPYVPLTIYRSTGEDDFQPRIGFKTRYGMTHNPFVSGTNGQNTYYRKFAVVGL